MRAALSQGSCRRLRIEVTGAVQGVGFRPHVHRLASDYGLAGWVRNTSGGVEIELEGDEQRLHKFLRRLRKDAPPLAFILGLQHGWREPVGDKSFRFLGSDGSAAKTAVVLPDAATCDACLAEVFDPSDRRHRYPFTNCTNCGPRFSITESLPYDRERTTMKRFAMCEACRTEYDDPANRRFHAQPNACPDCGPRLEFWCGNGDRLIGNEAALGSAVQALQRGEIVAVKGLGGFHLFADAARPAVVRLLRQRKRRSEKPFAVMAPSLAAAHSIVTLNDDEETLLVSAAAPIVIAQRTDASEDRVCADVAPGNPTLGVMLPSNPLHALLMRDFGRVVVATSGNLSDEPLATDEHEARTRLGAIADAFLVHDRPIAHPVDDSVVRVVAGRPLILRRARGYAPFPVGPASGPTMLAVGAHQKSTVALSTGEAIVLSQHLGDLDTPAADCNFRNTIRSLTTLYERKPEAVVCDLHPDYRSTIYAEESGLPLRSVQHHVAHVFACLADNEIDSPALGVAWDGTGLGTDGHVWGGEFFAVSSKGVRRVACLREFPLPGGERAVHEPRRSALGVLWERFGAAGLRMDVGPVHAFGPEERTRIGRALERDLNTPRTSSAGRLFDAVASLAGLRQYASFEGQAAMELEFALAGHALEDAYPFLWVPAERAGDPGIVDWGPAIDALLDDVRRAVPPALISARFHEMLVESILAVARACGIPHVALTGGCFQNAHLTERCVIRLRDAGFDALWHRRIPPNDGGIAVGQLMAAMRGA